MGLKLKKTIPSLNDLTLKVLICIVHPNLLMTTGIASPSILTELIILVCFFAGSHVSCFTMLYNFELIWGLIFILKVSTSA